MMDNSSSTNATSFAFRKPKKEVGVGILFTVFVLFGICGNSLVITVLQRKMKHSFKTMAILLTSLAIGALLNNIFVGIPNIVQRFAGTWRAGSVVCKIYSFLAVITGEISAFTHAAIGFDRFRSMTKKDRKPIKTVYWYIVLACIWAYVIVGGLPYILVFDIREISGMAACSFRPDSEDYTTFVDFVLSFSKIANFSIPLTLIVISYGGVIWQIWKAQRRVQPLNSTTSHNKKQKQVAKLCAFVVVAFLVLWSPMRIAVIARVFFPQMKVWPIVIGYSMIGTILGSCLNSIVYGLMWKQFRDKALEMLVIKCRTPEENEGNDITAVRNSTNVSENNGVSRLQLATTTPM